MADSDPRAEEIEMLQAMYNEADGELTFDDSFSFTLRLVTEPAILELAVSLLEGYPDVLPVFRIMCGSIARDDMDELTKGLTAEIQEHMEVGCVSVAAEWVKENAPDRMHIVAEPDPNDAVTLTEERKGLRNGTKCVMWEERGDLFEVGDDWALCHCVSKDLDMSAGIAVDFKKTFGGVPELKSQCVEVGGVAVLQKKGRTIYYLVTKNKHGGKPTMVTLGASLKAMREHMVSNGIKKLAMPHIGCGLDHLSWGAVAELVLEIFDGDDVELMARAL